MANEDPYIQLLRLAKADIKAKPEGISLEEFSERLARLGIRQKASVLFERMYDHGGDRLAYMGLDAYMMLLDYDELKHSLEESKQARRESKWAIWISILAIVAQIIFR